MSHSPKNTHATKQFAQKRWPGFHEYKINSARAHTGQTFRHLLKAKGFFLIYCNRQRHNLNKTSRHMGPVHVSNTGNVESNFQLFFLH